MTTTTNNKKEGNNMSKKTTLETLFDLGVDSTDPTAKALARIAHKAGREAQSAMKSIRRALKNLAESSARDLDRCICDPRSLDSSSSYQARVGDYTVALAKYLQSIEVLNEVLVQMSLLGIIDADSVPEWAEFLA